MIAHTVNAHFSATTFGTRYLHRMGSFEAAIAELRSSNNAKFATVAKKYNIERTTLMRRFKGQTASMEQTKEIGVFSTTTKNKS